MSALPTGTVTFLFTDLEGSTRLWEGLPDAMREALARHDEILRDAIVAHDGYIVKMTGDGAHAAFATAHDAMNAAVDALLALRREAWRETGPLRVRVGLHTGRRSCATAITSARRSIGLHASRPLPTAGKSSFLGPAPNS